MTESETFLKQQNPVNGPPSVRKYSFEMSKKGEDLEANNYDPLSIRDNENATTYFDTFVHLFKSSVGVGILSMPFAFKNTGIMTGVFLMILVSTMCINCSYVLIFQQYCPGTGSVSSTLLVLLVPLILLCYIPNLKYLSPVSAISNVCMIYGLFVTSWYILQDFNIESLKNVEIYSENIIDWPVFLSTSIFAMTAIGTIMPLENNMKHPKKYVGTFGVLNVTLTIVALLYFVFGFLGYLTYAKNTAVTVIDNVPKDNLFAQSGRLSIALSVLCGYTLIFYVSHDIVWQKIKPMFGKKQTIANFGLRTLMVIISIAIAITCESIESMMGIIGGVFFSILGLMLPIFIEIVTFWNEGWGLNKFRTYKNLCFLFVSLICLSYTVYDFFKPIDA